MATLRITKAVLRQSGPAPRGMPCSRRGCTRPILKGEGYLTHVWQTPAMKAPAFYPYHFECVSCCDGPTKEKK